MTLENPKKETQINQNELDSDRERIYCHRILVQNWIYLDRRQFRNPDLSSCAFYINTPYRWREALTTVGTSSGKPAQRRDQIFFHPPEVSIGLHPRGPTAFRCEISRRVARLHRCTHREACAIAAFVADLSTTEPRPAKRSAILS